MGKENEEEEWEVMGTGRRRTKIIMKRRMGRKRMKMIMREESEEVGF